VNVFVAILAEGRCNLEKGFLDVEPFGFVALLALHFRVQVHEWVFRFGMVFHTVYGGLPIIHVVARGAFTLVRASGELAIVRVLVAIHAIGERHLRLEIVALVTTLTRDLHVLSEQGEFRFLVVESRELRHVLPTGSHVAALAGCGKGAFVRIDVTRGTFIE